MSYVPIKINIFPSSFVQVRVTYRTLNEAQPQPFRTPGVGRATEGRDFVPLMDSVVFLANQSEANITLRVLDDEDPERDESVFVMLISVQLIEGEQDRPSKILMLFYFATKKNTKFNDLMKHPWSTSFSFQLPCSGLWDRHCCPGDCGGQR